MNANPFTAQSLGVRLAATTVASASAALPNSGNSIRIVNEGPNHAYVSIGTAAQVATVPTGTAAATCCVVLAGADVTLGIASSSILNISAITPTGTASLDIYVGEGV